MKVGYFLFLILVLCASQCDRALGIFLQDSIPAQAIFSRYITGVSTNAEKFTAELDRRNTKALQQWQKLEARIKRKLAKTDSLKAADIFGNAKQQYGRLIKSC
jgi:hypothetical protein